MVALTGCVPIPRTLQRSIVASLLPHREYGAVFSRRNVCIPLYPNNTAVMGPPVVMATIPKLGVEFNGILTIVLLYKCVTTLVVPPSNNVNRTISPRWIEICMDDVETWGSHDGRIDKVHHNVVIDFNLQFDVLGIFIVSIEGLVMCKLAYGANCIYQYIYILSHFV